MNITLITGTAVLVVLMGFAAVWVTDRRAQRQQDINAAKLRHPSGRDLNNGR